MLLVVGFSMRRNKDLDKAKTMHVVEEELFTVAKLLDNSGKAITLGKDAIDFTERILEALVPEDKAQELLRTLRGE